jgi:hypothetical protein
MFAMMTQATHDAFRFWQRAAETMTASAYVIDKRSRMMTTGRVPTAADMAELGMMVSEKLTAFGLAHLALTQSMLAGTAASWGAAGEALAPIHARATANARRLQRSR